jgi:hypothetical protein
MVCSGILTRGSSSFARVFPSNGQWRRAAPRIQWRDRAGISPASRAQTYGPRLGRQAGLPGGRKGGECDRVGFPYSSLLFCARAPVARRRRPRSARNARA